MKKRRKVTSSQRGASLVEVLVSVAIAGVVIVVFLSALSTSSGAVRTSGEKVTAVGLARSQLEHTKSSFYRYLPASYDAITAPAGYSISVAASAVPGAGEDIQTITVTVYHHGRDLLSVEDFKVNR